MSKLISQSKWHWLMTIPTLFLILDKKIGLTLVGTLLLSLIIGLLIEIYQYVNEKLVKGKKIDLDYYLNSTVDLIVTVVAGVIGYYLGLIFK